MNEHDLETRRQTLDENVPNSPLPKRRTSLVGTHSEDVFENFITEVSEIKKKKLKGIRSWLFATNLDFHSQSQLMTLVACQVCSTLVGCQRYTDTWFGDPGGLTKSCPKCRAPRGLANSFILKGLENFVEQISEMMRDPNNK